MKLTTEALSAHRFIYETDGAKGPIVVELDPSSGVTGCWTSDDRGHLVDAGTDESLVVDRLEVPLAEGPLSLRGPVRGEGVAVDLSTHDTPVDATITVDRLAGTVEASLPSMDHPIELERLDGEGISVRLGAVHRFDAECVTMDSVMVQQGAFSVRLDGVRAEVVALRVGARGRWRVRVGRLTAREVTLGIGGDRLRIDDVSIVHFLLDREGGASVGQATARRARWNQTAGNAQPKTESGAGAQPPFPWRVLLRGLDGTLAADVRTDVKVALMPAWSVLHPLRLDLERGRVRYQALENSMHALPDAVLDFEVGERRLELIKDIPFVPFDRRTLLSWPLPRAEELDAQHGWVALTRLLDPEVHVRRRPRGRDDGGQRLEAIRADAIRLQLSRPGGEAIDLGSFGRVTLDGDEGGLEELELTGRVVYRPDMKSEPGHLALRGQNLGWGLDPLRLGHQEVTLSAARVDRFGARFELDGIRLTDLVAEVHGLHVEDLTIADGLDRSSATDAAQ